MQTKNLIIFIVTIVLFLGIRHVYASPNYNNIDTIIQNYMRDFNIPGIAVTVTKGDKVVYLKSFGVGHNSQPLAKDTKMYIGSLSKSFTALAIMQLAEERKIDIDKPVKTYLPYFKVNNKYSTENITVRHLLNQTSGLSEMTCISKLKNTTSQKEGVLDLKSAEPVSKPGEEFHYFNPNYMILGAIVEEVTGEKYEKYMKDNILVPLEMRNTVLDIENGVTNLSDGFGAFAGFPIKRKEEFIKSAISAGYIVSTPEDISKYMIFQNKMNKTLSNVLSDRNLDEMHMQTLKTKPGYGMGWFVNEKYNGIKVVEHKGELKNFHADIILLPNFDYGISIMTNQNHALYDIFVYPELRENLTKLVIGMSYKKSSTFAFGYLFLIFVGITTIIASIYKTVKVKEIFLKTKEKGLKKVYYSIIIDAIMPIIFLTIFPYIFGKIIKRGFSFEMIWGLTHDLVIWFLVICILALIRALYKISILHEVTKKEII
ncbi:MAG TPA: hypothetical protein DEP72_08810 [Clostridiales bacterium]|nr:MAG: hypothetical protein A2Y18_03750 [Clostridiales bacterium GWD2_32_19]HCC08239.1 hypothetical protein [Clostridiales bacterium]